LQKEGNKKKKTKYRNRRKDMAM